MSFETIPGTNDVYGLISFDADGNERPGQSGLMSRALIQKAAAEPITDIFFFCHGWQGDVPAAKDQYRRWMGAFARSQDRQQALQVLPAFQPLLIGLHWPSQPWGDEELRGAAFAGPAGTISTQGLLADYLARLGDTPAIRKPLELIINEAARNFAPDDLPAPVRQAYLDLNAALGLGSDGVAAAPDADREPFDPQQAFDAANQQPMPFGVGDLSLGGLLGPLRLLSYWTMKKRARSIGESGMHRFLQQLQHATAGRSTRIHLMGHSFGTIVVSSMVGGPNAQAALPRPVSSLVLVQGAVSLWCYARRIPFRDAGAGYFNHVLTDNKIRGPLVATRSKFDDAVGIFYPLASRLGGSPSFAAELPEYGGIGIFGIQGLADGSGEDLAMLPAAGAYAFKQGRLYNLDGSQFIRKKEGVSGAHNDIDGPEIAHVLWAAALASV